MDLQGDYSAHETHTAHERRRRGDIRNRFKRTGDGDVRALEIDAN